MHRVHVQLGSLWQHQWIAAADLHGTQQLLRLYLSLSCCCWLQEMEYILRVKSDWSHATPLASQLQDWVIRSCAWSKESIVRTCVLLECCCRLQEVNYLPHVWPVGGLLCQTDQRHLSNHRQHRVWNSARVQGRIQVFLYIHSCGRSLYPLEQLNSLTSHSCRTRQAPPAEHAISHKEYSA